MPLSDTNLLNPLNQSKDCAIMSNGEQIDEPKLSNVPTQKSMEIT